MMKYHGTPISPRAELLKLAGRNFCVSYAAPADVTVCHAIGQSVMLDNGAFSFWRQNRQPDLEWWVRYYEWCEPWLDHQTTWAVIPDVIGGTEYENDVLIRGWPHGQRGAPVWHLHESIDRLLTLTGAWPRVCFGSSGSFSVVGSDSWRRRVDQAFNALCGNGPCPVWVHMLRGMAASEWEYPFASVDSTDVGRNHNRPQNSVVSLADRWDSKNPPARWQFREQLELV